MQVTLKAPYWSGNRLYDKGSELDLPLELAPSSAITANGETVAKLRGELKAVEDIAPEQEMAAELSVLVSENEALKAQLAELLEAKAADKPAEPQGLSDLDTQGDLDLTDGDQVPLSQMTKPVATKSQVTVPTAKAKAK